MAWAVPAVVDHDGPGAMLAGRGVLGHEVGASVWSLTIPVLLPTHDDRPLSGSIVTGFANRIPTVVPWPLRVAGAGRGAPGRHP